MNSASTSMYVSVIIPVYKDWNRLLLCLKALKHQTYPAYNIEIIIVNNCVNDDSDIDLSEYENVTILNETKVGSYSARNKGIMHAKGNVFAFTDSDCIPHQNWLENALILFENKPEAHILAGKVDLFAVNEISIFDKYEFVFGFPIRYYVERYKFGVTANLIVKREVFERVGFFNSALKSGGDVDFCNRADKKGFEIVYSNDLAVRHPTRGNLKELELKARRIAGKSDIETNLLKSFFRAILRLRIPISDYKIIKTNKGLSLKEKFYIFFIRTHLKNISAYESFRILFGKASNRV